MSFGERFLRYPDLFPARPSGEPWGEGRILVRFAGHDYHVMGLSTIQEQDIRQRFGKICLPPGETPESAVEIQVFRAALEDFEEQDRISSFDFELDYAEHSLRFAGLYCMGRLDWTPHLRATLWTSEEDRLSLFAIFGSFFRMIVTYHLFDRSDGLLLHSAAVVNQSEAFIFFGPSGAGKSTISRLSIAAGHTALNDDMNALRNTPKGVMVERLPFAGELGYAGMGADGTYPVRALCRLYQGRDPILGPLRPTAAVSALLGCAPFINRNPYYRDRLLDYLYALAAKVPVQALTFALDDRFWSFLSRENAHV